MKMPQNRGRGLCSDQTRLEQRSRLTNLEQIASSYEGVEKTFAIQAGREVRIVVHPDRVNDGRAQTLAEEVARRIEGELQYPGQIRVVVIRETRSVEVAR